MSKAIRLAALIVVLFGIAFGMPANRATTTLAHPKAANTSYNNSASAQVFVTSEEDAEGFLFSPGMFIENAGKWGSSAYLTGSTIYSNFLIIQGIYDTSFSDQYDVYVIKSTAKEVVKSPSYNLIYADDFSAYVPNRPPTGWSQFGNPTILPVIEKIGGIEPSYQLLHFPVLIVGKTTKWLIKDDLIVSTAIVETKINFQSNNDEAGLSVAFQDENNHILVTANPYGDDLTMIEVRGGNWRQSTSVGRGGGELGVQTRRDYWLRVELLSVGGSSAKTVVASWSADGVNYIEQLRLNNLENTVGRIGFITWSYSPPHVHFDDLMVYGSQAGPWLNLSPSLTQADSASNSTIDLVGVPAGHRVQLKSSLSGSTFAQRSGVVDANGQFVTTIRSSTPGDAIITAVDETTGETFATSAKVTFTAVGGQVQPPPAQNAAIAITGIKSEFPLSGIYPITQDSTLQAMLGDNLSTKVYVTVDWQGSTPDRIDYVINGTTHNVPANSTGASFYLDMSRMLRNGNNDLRIVAYNTTGQVSQMEVYSPNAWEIPQWLGQLLKDADAGDQTLATQSQELQGIDAVKLPGVEVERVSIPPAINIWLKLPPTESISRVYVPVGKFETKGIQAYARLQIPLDGKDAYEFRGGARYLNEFERRRAAGFDHKGLSIFGTEFTSDAYLFGRAKFDVFALRPESIGGGMEIEVNRTWEKSWLALLYLLGLPDPTPALKAIPVFGDDIAHFVARIASGNITLEGRGGGELVYRLEPVRQFDSLDVTLGGGVEIGMQADIRVAKIKGRYGADLDTVFMCVRNTPESQLTGNLFCDLTFRGSGGMEVSALGLKYDINDVGAFEKHWPESLLAQNDENGLAPAQTDGWQLIGHVASKEYSAFEAWPESGSNFVTDALLEQSEVLASWTLTGPLVSNVYTHTEPSLAINPINNDALLLWVHDDIAKSVGQSHEIHYSLWNGSEWGLPAAITNNILLDGDPQVAWMGDGKGVAIWRRLNEVLSSDATLNVTTTQKIEIATATYDPAAVSWSPVSLLTNNTALDMTPALARNAAGNLLAVWRQNESGLLSGDKTHPDRIMTAWYDASWTAPAVAVDNIPGLVDLAAAYGSGEAAIAFTRYFTPTGSITPTLQLYTSRYDGVNWSAPQQLTDDANQHTHPQVIYRQGQPYVVWLAGDTLTLQSLSALQAQASQLAAAAVTVPQGQAITLDTDLQVDQFRVLQDSNDNLFAVFTGQQSQQRDLYLAYYDNAAGTWGHPQRLTDDRASESYPAAALSSSDQLLMAYARTVITDEERTATDSVSGETITYTLPVEGQTDLYTLSHSLRSDLAVESLVVSDAHPQPGATLTFTATLANRGDVPLSTIGFAFRDDGVDFDSHVLPGPLVAGEVMTLTATYVVPGSGGAHTFSAVADPDDAIAEQDEGNNEATLTFLGPDLAINVATVEHWSGSEVGLTAVLKNQGNAPSPATTLAYHWDDLNGTEAASDDVPALQAGEIYTLTTPWDYGLLAGGGYTLTAVLNPDQQDFPEVFVENNIATLTFEVLPDLAVSPYYVWATALPDGSLAITATVSNFGSVAAGASELVIYADEPFTDTAEVATLPVPILNPAGSTLLSTTWQDPPAGDHTLYVSVNGERSQQEVTWENNLASTVPQALQSVALSQGWTLLSFRVQPASVAVSDVLATADGYDRVLGETGTFDPALPANVNTLTEMQPGLAYWLRTTAAATLSISGIPVDSATPINLHAGWNWIGYLPDQPMSVADALASIAGKYTRIIGDDGAYDANLPASFNTLTQMEPGKGYIIFMSEAGMLVYGPAAATTHRQIGPRLSLNQQLTSACASVQGAPAFTEVWGTVDATAGSVVTAWNPRGQMVGCFVVHTPGMYGLMRIFGEDIGGGIPGMRAGEIATFQVDGAPAVASFPFAWYNDRDWHRLDLDSVDSPDGRQIWLPLLRRGR